MLRRWARSVMVTVIVSIVVGASLGQAAAPVAMLLDLPGLSADLGAVRIEVKI